MKTMTGSTDARGLRVALVVARYHDFVTDRLRDGARDALTTAGALPNDLLEIVVPGAFEIPLAARRVAASGRVDAVVCLGCVIRGGTAHFKYIASTVSRALMDVSTATGVPIGFGVLTTDSAEQALERVAEGPANKGWEAAMAAVEMATLLRGLGEGQADDIRV